MDLNKYENDGWGLSKKEFELLYEEIQKHSKTEKADTYVYNVVEFGSGGSTEFLIDAKNEFHFPLKIYSFDDSKVYAFKGTDNALVLKILPLVETDDATFEKMFVQKKYEAPKMKDKFSPLHTRQKNTFYKIDESHLPFNIDLLIVDGPHGNGRSLAYLHCMKKLSKGALVLIDDASHYPFHEHLSMLLPNEVIFEQHIKENKWSNGGDFILTKIL